MATPRCLVIPVLLATAIGARAQYDQSLLWHITADDGRHGYVYGTVHSRDARAYRFAGHVMEVTDRVNTVAGELDPQEAAGGMLAMMGAMMLPDDMRIPDLYKKKKDRELVEQAMREKLGPLATMFMRMKPFFVMATMAEQNLGTDHEMILDAHLLSHAQEQGRRVIGLETMREQLRAIDAATLQEQADMLLEHVRKGGEVGAMEDMLNAYAAHDVPALVRTAADAGTLPRTMESALIVERNRVMAHRMDSVLRADTSALFVIGTLHLPGAEGVVALLHARGYQVEPVALSPRPLEAPRPKAPAPDLSHMDTPPPYGPPLRIKSGIHYRDPLVPFGMDMYTHPERLPVDEGVSLVCDADDRAVVVTVSDQQVGESDFSFMHEAFDGQDGHVVHVQGVEGRRVAFVSEGQEMEALVLLRDNRLWLVVVVDADVQRRAHVLDSFHFTDLPE
jgi:uncharacterized protein YbaP (TraB family)